MNEIYLQHKDKYDNLIELFREENSKINLSSFNDKESILNKHILDSLNIFKFKDWYQDKNIKIADIGSGGGFPGLALAIAMPHDNFFLIESISKKAKAIKFMANALNLQNITVINNRVENIKEEFDVTISRAVAEFKKIYEWSSAITKQKGKMYFYKSKLEQINGFNDKIEYEISGSERVIYEFIK